VLSPPAKFAPQVMTEPSAFNAAKAPICSSPVEVAASFITPLDRKGLASAGSVSAEFPPQATTEPFFSSAAKDCQVDTMLTASAPDVG